MPVDRITVSLKSFAEELGFDPERFVGLQLNRVTKTVTIFLEPEDDGADKRDVPAVER